MAAAAPKLEFVRVYLGEQRMDVRVHDPSINDSRVVVVNWQAGESTDVPPEVWYETVLGEIDFQRSRELKRAEGRLLPGE